MINTNRDWKEFLLSPAGRISRWDYWVVFFLISFCVFFVSIAIDAVLRTHIFINIAVLALFYPQVIVGIKRCHDRNRSGWFMLINFIPLIGPIWFLIEMLLKGTTGSNQFGPDPLDFVE